MKKFRRDFSAPSGGNVGPRSTLKLEQKRNLVVAGLAFLALALLVSLTISYQLVFMGYAILSTFIFCAYIFLWMDGGDERKVSAPYWPSVSIIIPSFNTAATIFDCIATCKSQHYKGKLEVIVVDDCSSDGSYEKLEKMKGIRLFRKQKNAGKASALNFGIARAGGEIIVGVDSDTYLAKDTLSKAVKHFFEGENVGSVVVFVTAAAPKNILQAIQEIEYWTSFGFFFRAMSSIDGIYVTPGPTALYRKSVLDSLGGFDEKNLSEDLEIALRLQKNGYRIVACHETMVKTEVPDTLPKLLRQRIRWYRGGVMNIIKYIELFFNPKHGHFGFFVLPTMLGSGFLAALFMAWTLLFFAGNALSFLLPFAYNFSAGVALSQIAFANGLIVIHSGWILWIFTILLWLFFLIKSLELGNTKFKLRHVLPVILMVWVYPLFIGIAFLVSYIYELFGVKYTW